jgi:hypothetical protein
MPWRTRWRGVHDACKIMNQLQFLHFDPAYWSIDAGEVMKKCR